MGGARISALGAPRLGDRAETLRWTAAAIAVPVVIGWTTVRSLQAALSLALVGSVAAARVVSPVTGAVALWSLWLVAPLVRRVLDLYEPSTGPDILAVAPFAATAAVAAVDYSRNPPSGRGRVVLAVAGIGLLLGIPMGLSDPAPATFAFVAYGCSLSAFVIGFADQQRPGVSRLPLARILFALVPLVAVYAVYQGLFPLPEWDAYWVQTADLVSIGRKEYDNFRVFATLNSPATLAAVLAALVAMLLAVRRVTAAHALCAGLVLLALALTFVRSAWIAVLFAMLLSVALTGGRRLGLVLLVAVLISGTAVFAGSRSTLGSLFVERAASLTSLESDVSAQDRLRTTSEVLPQALRAPLGAGLGAVGQARQLSDARGGDVNAFPDNGWLATLFQLGPVGFLLVLGTLAWAAFAAFRRTAGTRRQEARLMCALVVGTLLLVHVSTDVLYGISGAILWYCLGGLVGMADGEDGAARG